MQVDIDCKDRISLTDQKATIIEDVLNNQGNRMMGPIDITLTTSMLVR